MQGCAEIDTKTDKLLTCALVSVSTCRECPFAQVGVHMHAVQQQQGLFCSEVS